MNNIVEIKDVTEMTMEELISIVCGEGNDETSLGA